MNKHKIISAIALLIFFYTSGFCAESKSFTEKKENGRINWQKGVVQAKGIGIPSKNLSGASKANNPKTLSEAKNKARRNLLETVKSIRINSSLNVINAAAKNQTIMAKIKEMVYEAPEIESLRKYMSDGTVEVHLQMSLHGGFTQLILPKDIQQIEPIKQVKPGKNSPSSQANKSVSTKIYTGLVIDARGIDALPALVPKIFDENLKEVFGPAFVSREFVVQQGMVAYFSDIKAAKADSRIADYPLIVKALKTDFPSRCNLVISNADAAKLRSASEHLLFLKECRVIIILDPL